MRKVRRISDPRQMGIHIEPRPNLDVFIYTNDQRR